MWSQLTNKSFHWACALVLCGAALLAAPPARAQAPQPQATPASVAPQSNSNTSNSNTTDGSVTAQSPAAVAAQPPAVAAAQPPAVVMPVYTNYRGITIGMSADEVRQKLDHLKEKGKKQDFFVFSNEESAQVFYNSDGLVRAVSVHYIGAHSAAPDAMTVLGVAVPAKANGSMYRLVRYPAVKYWVSYSRSAGDTPVTTVTMQKMR